MSFEPGRKYLEKTEAVMGKTCKLHNKKSPLPLSIPESSWCEATVLTAAPLSHPATYLSSSKNKEETELYVLK